jgi:hypothetical protein
MAEALPANRPEDSIGATLLGAFDLAQRVATDEVRLLHLESQERVSGLARRGAWLAAGSLCLLLAWLAVTGAVLVALAPYFSLVVRLGLVAASHAVLGAALVAWGLRDRGDAR